MVINDGFIVRHVQHSFYMGVARILERGVLHHLSCLIARNFNFNTIPVGDVTRVTFVASRRRQLTILKFNVTTARIRMRYWLDYTPSLFSVVFCWKKVGDFAFHRCWVSSWLSTLPLRHSVHYINLNLHLISYRQDSWLELVKTAALSDFSTTRRCAQHASLHLQLMHN